MAMQKFWKPWTISQTVRPKGCQAAVIDLHRDTGRMIGASPIERGMDENLPVSRCPPFLFFALMNLSTGDFTNRSLKMKVGCGIIKMTN